MSYCRACCVKEKDKWKADAESATEKAAAAEARAGVERGVSTYVRLIKPCMRAVQQKCCWMPDAGHHNLCIM